MIVPRPTTGHGTTLAYLCGHHAHLPAVTTRAVYRAYFHTPGRAAGECLTCHRIRALTLILPWGYRGYP